jgi:hypothetical protein
MKLATYQGMLVEIAGMCYSGEKQYYQCFLMDGGYLGWLPASALAHIGNVPLNPDGAFTEADDQFLRSIGVRL